MPRSKQTATKKVETPESSESQEQVDLREMDDSSSGSEAPVTPKVPAKKAKKTKPVQPVESSSEGEDEPAPVAPKKSKKTKKVQPVKIEASEDSEEQPEPPRSKKPKKSKSGSEDSSSDSARDRRMVSSKASQPEKLQNPSIHHSQFTPAMIRKIVPVKIKKTNMTMYLNIDGGRIPGFHTKTMKLVTGGFTIPNTDSPYYKREADVTFFRVPLDLQTKEGAQLADFLNTLFDRMESLEFRKMAFADKAEKYTFQRKLSMEPDDYHLQNRPGEPWRPTFMMSFRTHRYDNPTWSKPKTAPGKKIVGDANNPHIDDLVFEVQNGPNKEDRTSVEPTSISVIRENMPFLSEFHIGFVISHMWVVNQNYGVRFYIKKLVVRPRASAAPTTFVSDDESSGEELEPTVRRNLPPTSFDAPTKKATKDKKSKAPVVEDPEESSEEHVPPPKKSTKTKAPVVEDPSEDSSEGLAPPPKKGTKKATKKPVVADPSEDSSEEHVPPPKKGTKKAAKKPVVADPSEDSSEDLVELKSESESSEAPAAPTRTRRSKRE